MTGLRVLVVDDEPVICRLAIRILEGCGFVVEAAANGPAAIDAIVAACRDHQPFAAVVLDVGLPGWSGVETARRAWEHDPFLQIVLCTGNLGAIERADLGAASPDSVLLIAKPFEAIEIEQAVRALAVKWRLARAARAHVQQLEDAVSERTRELAQANHELAKQLAWRDRTEAELRLAQRLEAVGHLAAGVAHEINTPIQYVGDNVHFLRECAEGLIAALAEVRAIALEHGGAGTEAALEAIENKHQIPYIAAELPQASASIDHGVQRIGKIVGALRELSHPGDREMKAADVNHALESALEISAHAYRYIADVETDLADLPPVRCHVGELGQVFLNLIVNAADAMTTKDRRQRGRLGIQTRLDGDHVVIAISDTGAGIPEPVRDRIFDPFFTTKDVGRGTGQGLAIARTIVTRHDGTMTFASVVGAGTTFYIRVPVAGPRQRDGVAA